MEMSAVARPVVGWSSQLQPLLKYSRPTLVTHSDALSLIALRYDADACSSLKTGLVILRILQKMHARIEQRLSCILTAKVYVVGIINGFIQSLPCCSIRQPDYGRDWGAE